MFILLLDDPLWRKLDDAHRNRDITQMLQDLTEAWESETADAVFWDHLCHQDTCYGATYAAVPHLLKLAQRTDQGEVRGEIAFFLGHVAHVAHFSTQDGATLQGLPETLEGWAEKLEVYRDSARYSQETIANSSLPQDERDYAKQLLADATTVLETPAVTTEDLDRIDQIRTAFYDAQPAIAALCIAAYQKADSGQLHLLEGLAAALGDQRLAALFL